VPLPALKHANIAIVGTGLMGASLALALRGSVGALFGVDSDPETCAFVEPYFDAVGADLTPLAARADVVILAVPVRSIVRLIETIGPTLKPGTLVFDLGSVKAPVIAAMDALLPGIRALGGHPMCGSERSGPSAAIGALYQGVTFAVCRSRRTDDDALAFALALVDSIGARPLILDAAVHDRAVAAVSHLPYAVSAMLVAAAAEIAGGDSAPWQLASSGFRDTSRLAGSDLTMMTDILFANREAVLAALDAYAGQVAQLRALLDSGDEAALRALLDLARSVRTRWAESRE
jgi:prephenate dehydrogenase